MDAFGLARGALSLVAVSENVTFRVDAPDGDAYVLRLHRPGYHTLAELDSERAWTAALAGAGMAVPRGVTTNGGRHYVEVVAADGERRYAGVTRWIEGTPLGRVLRAAEAHEYLPHFDAIGAIAATLHNQSSGWAAPAGFTRHAFDVDGLFGETPFWGRFWDSPLLSRVERRLVVRTRDAIGAALTGYGADARTYSLIHADLHFGNVLVDGDRLAVIDFDDCGFGWHQYELAVVLFGHPAERFDAHFASLLRGYRRVRAFPDEDAALVPMFVVVRALALLGWIEQRPEHHHPGAVEAHKERACTLCESLDTRDLPGPRLLGAREVTAPRRTASR